MMLLLSPMGWVYYFSLLIFPLTLTWIVAIKALNFTNKPILFWLLLFFLLDLPQSYIMTKYMQNFAVRLIFSSSYFYGLLLLNYILAQKKIIPGKNEIVCSKENYHFIAITFFILLFGVIVTALKITASL